MTLPEGKKKIRSYVRREGRITSAQSRALETLMPRFGTPAEPKQLDLVDLFNRNAKCWIEIGFGNGDNLLALATQHCDTDFLGIEVHRPGVGRVLNILGKEALTNIRVACEDAFDLLRDRISSASIDRVILLFPDPWPKKKHHKRRIVQPDFVTHVANVLAPGGIFQLATDWTPYAEHMLEVIGANENFTNLSASGAYVARPAERPETRYEKRGGQLGHDVHDLVFRSD